MSAFLNIALDCIQRGWHVFPCFPPGETDARGNVKDGKEPRYEGAYKDATLDEAQVRAWAEKTPKANVGIAPGRCGKIVVDVDTGLTCEDDLSAFRARYEIPETYAVRTGRRPEYRVQLYFDAVRGPVESFNGWRVDEYAGDVRGTWGHVMAPGCLHKSGATYEVLWDKPLAPAPPWVYQLPRHKVRNERTVDPNAPITEWRNDTLIRALGKHRADGADDAAIEFLAHHYNETRIQPPLGEDELVRIIKNACGWPIGEPEPVVTIGGSKEPEQPRDWRTLFHSKEEALNAPPITFLIKDFLQREGVTAIAGPVRERKSLIALNVAHALVTGEKLFDYFEVVRKPERVLYLCPEVSLGPFTDRLKKIGLMDHVGDTLFYRTLSADGHLTLDASDLKPALPGSVVILDTAIRFLEGDENSSQDVRAFADNIFALLRDGAEAVVLLHHSPKESGDVMTLENAMRGSGDMGAFLACCWGTKLQDPAKPYESASFLSNLKQRDFESKDFEATSGPDCRMHIVGDPVTRPVTLQSRKGNKGNRDGKDEAAAAVIRANPTMPLRKLQGQLAALGIERGTTWLSKARARIQIEAGEAILAG